MFSMTLVKSQFKFYFQLYIFNTTALTDSPTRWVFPPQPIFDLCLLALIISAKNSIVDALQGHKYISVGVHLCQISGED